MTKKTKTQIGMDMTRNAILVHQRLANAALREKKIMESEGIIVPGISISVKSADNPPWNPDKYFIKSYTSCIEEVKKEYGLTIAEMGIIYMLSSYIDYENNLISNHDGTPIIKKDLEAILGLGQNAVVKHIASLVSKDIIVSSKNKRSVNYYLNPRIFYMGNRIDRTLLSMFHTDIKSFK
ncbi:hypothetical protein K9O30_01710 [Clostridium bowmanii]|uniref:hypothetical protein n=1 Tax=Clostridium bowmanii TaxID=132925 RepID=UPI001C0AF76E|nr:hypothetical protein [Clostridium bowmanii]MBU3190314.1 hypothetical protein [Clostridium bowmanii]MCA1072474.1 hypothetical protein [Clostridium bowmanii]